MRIGIVTESSPGETRVAGTPSTVSQLVKLGYEVVVEAGAGEWASYPDADYIASDVAIVDKAQAWNADVVLKLNAPNEAELAQLKSGATVVSWLSPGLN
ncbi:MAG: NAD(P)(+) transhydrogenase (Re/Si-specific) subunit alpha, partial [Leifsonia sp.]